MVIDYTASFTDQYELAMGRVYLQEQIADETAVFDYFFRELPFKGGYAIFAGIETLLTVLETLCFDDADLNFLSSHFDDDYVSYLKKFRFTGSIYSFREGDLIFPTAPVLQVEAPLIQAQMIETLLLNILNFQTLIATKASRMRLVAKNKSLVDFGLRRAQGPAGLYASRAAIVGGFNGTSNVAAGSAYDIPISGTMAHSFVQSFSSELEAFRCFARHRPEDCVLLVDTYNTLESGIPNAITVAKEMEMFGHRLRGIRLDSGDLAYLSKVARQFLNQAGLHYVKIIASNMLDEWIIKSLMEQQAPIDVFGVGTSLVVGRPDGALDGVYKLSQIRDEPRLKLSENLKKVTVPFKKQVYRLLDKSNGLIGADIVSKENEPLNNLVKMHHPFEPMESMETRHFLKKPMLIKQMENGRRIHSESSLQQIAKYAASQLECLPEEYKRFENPHIYKIGLSDTLNNERNHLIQMHRKKRAA